MRRVKIVNFTKVIITSNANPEFSWIMLEIQLKRSPNINVGCLFVCLFVIKKSAYSFPHLLQSPAVVLSEIFICHWIALQLVRRELPAPF